MSLLGSTPPAVVPSLSTHVSRRSTLRAGRGRGRGWGRGKAGRGARAGHLVHQELLGGRRRLLVPAVKAALALPGKLCRTKAPRPFQEDDRLQGPLTTDALVGPLIDKSAFDNMQKALEEAKKLGGDEAGQVDKRIAAHTDTLTHVYTWIIRPDRTYEIKIDGGKARKGELLSDWDFLPPRRVRDPKASKPLDWVDEPKMDDPDDFKPDWWDKVPRKIKDKKARRPADWDDDVDGAWAPPMVDNPKYKGEWKPKSKWTTNMCDFVNKGGSNVAYQRALDAQKKPGLLQRLFAKA